MHQELLLLQSQYQLLRGLTFKSIMDKGDLVPLTDILGMVQETMNKSGSNKFLLDGYPRALEQAFAFEQQIAVDTVLISVNRVPVSVGNVNVHCFDVAMVLSCHYPHHTRECAARRVPTPTRFRCPILSNEVKLTEHDDDTLVIHNIYC